MSDGYWQFQINSLCCGVTSVLALGYGSNLSAECSVTNFIKLNRSSVIRVKIESESVGNDNIHFPLYAWKQIPLLCLTIILNAILTVVY